MMLYIKYESSGPCSFRQEDHPGIIPVEFGQIPISVSEEVVLSIPFVIKCKIVTPGVGVNFDPWGIT